jgi:hypothetical protein
MRKKIDPDSPRLDHIDRHPLNVNDRTLWQSPSNPM